MLETSTTSRYDGDVRWVSVLEAAGMLDVSRQRVYQLIESGALVSLASGTTILVSRRSVESRNALLEKEAINNVAVG